MNKKIGITLSFITVVTVVAVWFLFAAPRVQAPTSNNLTGSTTAPMESTASRQTVVLASATVEYSVNGFSPAEVTIRKGGKVTFTSVDGSPIWVASNAHPTHTEYDGTSRDEHCVGRVGTSFDQCTAGPSYSFVFLKVGTWGYHNHLSPNNLGAVTVVE